MVAFILSLKDLIWFLRAILITVFTVGVYLEYLGIPFFNSLACDHITTSSILIFLSTIGFLSPFTKLKKQNVDGGEDVMSKLSAAFIIVIGVLLVFIYGVYFHTETLVSVLTGLWGGIGDIILGFAGGLASNPIYQLYGLPVGVVVGLGGGWIISHNLWPRYQKNKAAEPDWQGAPQSTPPPPYTQPVQPVPQQPKEAEKQTAT